MENIHVYKTEEEIKKEQEIINKCQKALKKVREATGNNGEIRCYGCGVLQDYHGYCMCCKADKNSNNL